MPDELAIGYLGRILRLNDVSALPEHVSGFLARAAGSLGRDATDALGKVGTVAELGGMSEATLVRCHSLVPFTGAVLGVVSGDWLDDSYPSQLLRMSIMRSCDRLSLCSRCVDEDLDFWGFSYWRRSHQLHGVGWCQKHRCGLALARKSEVWSRLPHEVVSGARHQPAECVAQALDNEVLSRYADICVDLLARSDPISTVQMVSGLLERARAFDLLTTDTGLGRRLSDLAAQRSPAAWLHCFFPAVRSACERRVGADLDNTLLRLNSGCHTRHNVLAMALLYESAEQALAGVAAPPPRYETLFPAIEVHAKLVSSCAPGAENAEMAGRPKRLCDAARRVFDGEPIYQAGGAARTDARTLEQVIHSALLTHLAARPVAFA